MAKLLLAIFLFSLTSPAWATSYFLATASDGGRDSNSGLSVSNPWLTPNHSIRCGDVILAAASASYSPSNFAYGNWGTVTCPSGNNVAWLKCETFDACKIRITNTDGMDIDRSYWGVQGWEIDGTSGTGACFFAYPASGVTIHHIIYANDIVNVCGEGGFSASPNGTAGVDYFAVIGDIAYNAVGGGRYCTSGINMYEPVASDSLPGTHIYFSGNFSWDNVEGHPCNNGVATDGEGLFFDTTDGSQTGLSAYTMQMVMDNNISIFNGGRGIASFLNQAGASSSKGAHASIYFRHNTVVGNNKDRTENLDVCAEILVDRSLSSEVFLNLAVATASNACDGHRLYAYEVKSADSTVNVHDNFGYSAAGNNKGLAGANIGFSYGRSNVFDKNPRFANPVEPGAPSCRSTSSVPECMATVIANFTPTTAAAISYGYQVPSITPTYDPLFPQWVCYVNLPAALVTMGCLAAPPSSASAAIMK